MKKILISLFLIINSVYGIDTNIYYNNSMFHSTLKAMQKNKIMQKNNNVSYHNNIIDKYENKENIPEFVIKKNKEIILYRRGSFKIIEKDYIIKNPSSWITILVKEKKVWEDE